MRNLVIGAAALVVCAAAQGEPVDLAPRVLPPPSTPGAAVQPYVKIAAPLVALTHVRVLDGTGAPVQSDRAIVIAEGKIRAIAPASGPLPDGAKAIDLSGYTVLPGLVGMHDHLFYVARPDLDSTGARQPPLVVPQMTFSAPRLYLARVFRV